MSIDVLPDDALLEIFDFCVNQHLVEDLYLDNKSMKKEIEAWQPLVHVCRRWRSVVFGSPRRLNLRLVCTGETPARGTLDAWPALPLLIWDEGYPRQGSDNIIPILERSDRVCQIHLDIPPSEWENVSSAMQVPFPELAGLWLNSREWARVLPDTFSGGSAPRLRSLQLNHIPFPGLPKLLLSATHLVNLILTDIPHSGYFSPEAMVTALSMLTSLELFWFEFADRQSRPEQASRRPPPSTRSVLPALTLLDFKGASEYLDDLVACIDAPRLNELDIDFFNDIIFDTPPLIQFISRTPVKALEIAHAVFTNAIARVIFSSQTSSYQLTLETSCIELEWQAFFLVQVCTSCLPPLSTLEDLYIYHTTYRQPVWQDNLENISWLELVRPFTSVKNLYLSWEFAPCIAPALQELVGRRTTEVLPTLQNIFLEELELSGPVQEAIGQFVAARQVIGHPIAVSPWVNPEQDKVLGILRD
jgi:hypothetical protein